MTLSGSGSLPILQSLEKCQKSNYSWLSFLICLDIHFFLFHTWSSFMELCMQYVFMLFEILKWLFSHRAKLSIKVYTCWSVTFLTQVFLHIAYITSFLCQPNLSINECVCFCLPVWFLISYNNFSHKVLCVPQNYSFLMSFWLHHFDQAYLHLHSMSKY